MWTHIIAGLVALLVAGTVMAVAEPVYTQTKKTDEFELRAYAPMIVAETEVLGSIDEASGVGFRRLADFIFGNNTTPTGIKHKIAMTAPVTVEPSSDNVSMTSPLTVKGTKGKWRIHFVMPGEYDMDSLPKPNNPLVSLRPIPARNYAVIRFSGFAGEHKVARKTRELMMWLEREGIKPIGNAELARYDPPWTLPFLRRNEVMIRY